MLAKIFILFCCVYAGAGHVCMLSPPQQKPLKNINKPGSTSCLLLKGPCGDVPHTTSRLPLVGGSNFTVVFQKNLDHFNKASPGYFMVSVALAKESNFKALYIVADSDVPSLTLYAASVTIPEIKADSGPVPMVLQTKYVTNNPKAPAEFYQCSDILVRKEE